MKLKRYALVHMSNPSQAEDVAQDAFYEAVTHIDILMKHDHPEKWLMVTVKHKISNLERSNRRYLKRIRSLDIKRMMRIPSADTTEEMVVRRDQYVNAIEKIQQALSTQDLYLLERHTIEKVNHMEVSAELGITICASQKRLARIRKKLNKSPPQY